MKAYDKKMLVFAGLIFAAVFLASGCGCGKKEVDPETQEVLKISITPQSTPTEAPQEASADAVVTNGDLTMVNSYLANGGGSAAQSTAGSEASDSAEVSDSAGSSASVESSAESDYSDSDE